jgi:hypothetical protein
MGCDHAGVLPGRQSISRDGGKTWEDNWVMQWTRVAKD